MCAELLARAVIDGGAAAFRHYQDERDALTRDLFDVTDVIATFHWDIDEVKVHHALLSDAMKMETARVANFSV